MPWILKRGIWSKADPGTLNKLEIKPSTGTSTGGKGSGNSSQKVKPGGNFAPDSNPNLTVNMNQQNKHIFGTNENKTANSSSTIPKSPIDPAINTQKLVDDYAGTGTSLNSIPLGNQGSRERVKSNGIIGKYYDENTDSFVPTTNFIIHYSKKGVHIVPARP